MSTSAKASKTARSHDTVAPGRDSPGDRGVSLEARPSGLDFVNRTLAGQGQGLPSSLRKGIESLSGLPMGHVRVHYNSPRPAQFGAQAFAQGSQIHMSPGQEHTLPHEAWHVVQQAQGRVATTAQAEGDQAVNDQVPLEREADAMGAKALHASQGAAPGVTQASSHGGLSMAPPAASNSGAVIQCWPGPIDRWLEQRRGYQALQDPDRPLADECKVVGHQAQKALKTFNSLRRHKAADGMAKVGGGVLKTVLDAVGVSTALIPVGTILGAAQSGLNVGASAYEANRLTGNPEDGVKAASKAGVKEAAFTAAGFVPVVGPAMDLVEGVKDVGDSVLQTDKSRYREKQAPLDYLFENADLIDQAREKLTEGELDPVSKRRLEKAVSRYDAALAAGKAWQQGKEESGKSFLTSRTE